MQPLPWPTLASIIDLKAKILHCRHGGGKSIKKGWSGQGSIITAVESNITSLSQFLDCPLLLAEWAPIILLDPQTHTALKKGVSIRDSEN